MELKCTNCGKIVIRIPSEFKKSKTGNVFCSHTCSAIYNNKKRYVEKYCFNCNKVLSKSAKKYCNNTCRMSKLYKDNINKWLTTDWNPVIKNHGTPKWIKRYYMKKYNNKCQKCGWSEINPITGNTPLQLEHIDGHWDNNRPENFELLCPNCHSLTPTFGSLNKGNGRPRYYKK